jgi:hypothetical protein
LLHSPYVRAGALLGVAAIILVLGVAPRFTQGADHLDSPLVKTDGRLDLTDVYAFKHGTNTVLIMGVDPVAGVLSPTTFHPAASYDFKVDNDGDARENQTYKVTFGTPNGSGMQALQLRCVPVPACGNPNGAVLATGTTDQTIAVDGGGMVRAGVFDDPFFFDLLAFRNGLAFCPGGVGTNFFRGLDIAAIVLEIPSSKLGGHIGVWARTELNGIQVDRMARPAINTVFIHPDARKDLYNAGQPVHDQRDFRGDVVDTLVALGNTTAGANGLADILLPDILTFDTSSSAGFLNGRQLADDVIDIELGIITNGAVTTDCVANDSTFSSSFPYLAPKN